MSMDKRNRGSTVPPQKERPSQHISPWTQYHEERRRRPEDSKLVSFGERITYTFAYGSEVASIHYDRGRDKIFYRGHKVGDQAVEPWLSDLLYHFQAVLSKSEYADKFLTGYSELLNKIIPKKPESS